MSCITPIATSLAKVSAAIGSKDKNLYHKLLARHRKRFKELDAHYDSFDEDEGDVEEVTVSSRTLAQEFLNSIPGLLMAGAAAKVQSKRKSKVRWKLEDDDPLYQTFERLLEQRLPKFLSHMKRVNKQLLKRQAQPDERKFQAREPEAPGAWLSRSTPMRDALRHLIMGEAYNRHVGYKYAHALQCICRHFGTDLPVHGDPWTSMQAGARLEWLVEIDEALQSAGVPKKSFRVLGHMAYRGSPIPIPESESPNIGYLKLEEIKTAQKALAKANVDRIKGEAAQKGIKEVEGWLRFCRASKRDLICFYG